MRDFRDAKAMAQTLRESLTTKAVTISHSESLELVSRMLGVADWNTLSALLHAERRDPIAPAARLKATTALYPAIPLRDLVPFPNATYPMFVGREKTMHALNQAFEGGREVVVVIQREAAVDDPRFSDVYEIGILAQLLELETLRDGTLRVLTRGLRRVALRSFAAESAAYQAEVAEVGEGVARDARDLIRRIYQRFQDYTAAHGILVPDIWLFFDQTRDAGQIADTVATRMKLPIKDKYELLATLDPTTRLERIEALLDLSQRPVSADYAATKRRALDHADRRRHQYATLEHLLLALTEDANASVVMRACDADLGKLTQSLVQYLDNELKHRVIETGSAEPTAAFKRVDQRAAFLAQEVGYPEVTGVNALVALFAETRSPAAGLLAEHGVSRGRADKAIVRGLG
ncbi:LON peptidase substrate-binding domain-containing protein [Bradyrhizobium sp. 521_C7_N1_3]|uniref:LON peptidase substrate-binding domain-containing protein n=1 Tax=Bradyrhizobium TaxID=374 RepID=UPI002714F9D1|nr:LON peptidase substrate-binding domain-containing protein [Bradyrhizobium japonicum]WLB55606.1 LON peptidase substrate-binding domain-containing protein [Bradyrhizobium japonicum]WLB62503.1 LON peptidase substrate-binding domain-containing protein [Bradyrhizobium japonicum]